MMRLTNWIESLASRRNILLGLLVTIIVGAIMMVGIQPQMMALTGGLPILDTRLAYTFNDVNDLLTALGVSGRQLYTYHQIADSVFPLAYALTMAFVLAILAKRVLPENARTRATVLLPLVGAVFDYLENALIASQIASYPTLSPAIIAVATGMTGVKWIFMAASFAAILLLAVVSYLRRKQ